MGEMDLKKLTLLGVVVLILLKLVIYQNFFLGREAYFFSDDAIYATLAERFLKGDFRHGFHPYWSPGFPLATIPFYLVSGSWEKAQFLVSVFSATALIFVLFWFFKRYSLFFAFTVAFITAFSVSLQQLVMSGGMTEPLYLLLLWLGISFSWLALNSSKIRYFTFAGIFFGLAYLTRTETIAIFALFIFIALLSFILKKRDRLKILNKISVVSLFAGLAVYFYFPLTRLVKFTTFDFSIFNTSLGFVFSLPFLTIGLLGIPFEVKKIGSLHILKNIFPKIGTVLALFLLVNLPYIIFISIELGRPTLSGKYAYVGTGPYYALEIDRMTTMAQDIWSTDYIDYSSPYFNPKRATDFLLKSFNSGSMMQHAKKYFFESLQWYKSENSNNFFAGYGLYMAFAGFAFGILSRKFRMLTIYFTLLWLAGLSWVILFMGASYRYLVYAFPFFFYLQALAIYSTGLLTLRADKLPGVLMIILPGFLLGNFFMKNVDPSFFTSIQFTGGSKDHKMIGDFIKSQNIDVLGGRIEAIPFYAKAKLVYMPSSPPDDIVRYMKVWGVEYLLVRPPEVGYDFVAPIANPKFKHPDLSVFKRFDDGSLIWHINLTEEEKKNNLRLARERKLGL